MSEPQFGDLVTFSHNLKRGYEGGRKIWTPEPAFNPWGPDAGTVRKGILIGKRTLSEGRVHHDYEDGSDWEADKYVRAFLVAFEMHRKPVFVLPEHLSVIGDPA